MWTNWLARHRHPVNLILHLVGIPLAAAAVALATWAATSGPNWLWILAGALFIVGYALQFIGHRLEGNDPGEIILFKKILGRPYTAVADRQSVSQGNNR